MRYVSASLRSLVVLFGLYLLPIAGAWAAPVFSVTASPSGPHYGQPFTVSVNASGLTNLYAYEFDIDFNPALFQAGVVTEGPFLATAGSTFFSGGTIDNTAGIISFVFDSLLGPGAGASGSGVLDTISFMASATNFGPGTISLANVLAVDPTGNLISVQTSSAQVTVPEPGSILLVLAGLLLLVLSVDSRWGRHVKGFAMSAPMFRQSAACC